MGNWVILQLDGLWGEVEDNGRFITMVQQGANLTIAPHLFREQLPAADDKAHFLEKGNGPSQGKQSRHLPVFSLSNNFFNDAAAPALPLHLIGHEPIGQLVWSRLAGARQDVTAAYVLL